jgi:mono/diheme cytochrome c family protein
VLVSEIGALNERGILAKAGWAAFGTGDDPVGRGRAVFRAQCASCHTLDGYLGIRALVEPVDADMLSGILAVMKDQGAAYAAGTPTPTETLDYPHMPPLVGTDGEVEALHSYLMSLKAAPGAERR